jgi:hypothetical protein
MRWALERARQADVNQAFVWFEQATNSAIHPRYGDTGLGSAVIWHTIPAVMDADSAAGRLVTGYFGPQFGELKGPHGVLFRSDIPPGQLSTLAKRSVAFAAIHAEDLAHWAEQRDFRIKTLLEEVDAKGPEWFKALVADEDFTHLRKSASYYVPTAEQIAAAGLAPAEAWRPLQRHLGLALERGMTVVAPL